MQRGSRCWQQWRESGQLDVERAHLLQRSRVSLSFLALGFRALREVSAGAHPHHVISPAKASQRFLDRCTTPSGEAPWVIAKMNLKDFTTTDSCYATLQHGCGSR